MLRRNSKQRLPRIHAYAASFGEDLSWELISSYTQVNDIVLDPFAGAGTSILQSILHGRHAIGIDVDPLACRISRVLTSRFDKAYLASATQHFQERLQAFEHSLLSDPAIYANLSPGSNFRIEGLMFQVPSEPAIAYWFDVSHMATLSVISNLVSGEQDYLAKQAFEVALSSSIIRKWPNTLSYAMDIDHSRPHRPKNVQAQSIDHQFALFNRVLTGVIDSILSIQEALRTVEASASILEGDVTHELSLLEPESVDFIFTSPPYLNAIDYPRAHKFSQWWLSPTTAPLGRSKYLGLRHWDRQEFAEDILSLIPSSAESLDAFKRMPVYRNIVQYVADIAAVIGQLYRVARKGSSIVFVVADNYIAKMLFPVSAIIGELLAQAGFSSVGITQRAIKKTRRRYPFGANGFDGPMQNEYLVYGVKAS